MKNSRLSVPLKATLMLLVLLAGACKAKTDGSEKAAQGDSPGGRVTLTGAGATFPYPLYSKWMAEYNRANPNVRINYQSIGSGGGIRQIVANTVDFGATDSPMKPEEAQRAPGKIIHIPTSIGSVVVAYHLPELKEPLKLAPDVLVDMFLGKITKWNDPRLVKLNAGATLPAKNVGVVHRSDGSGTTAVFTDYLAAVSPAWKEKVGAGKSVSWPSGLGAKGNEGVTGQIKTTPGTIGYIELAYAEQNKLPVAHIQNQAGNFVAPSLAATSAAAQGVELPATLHASLVNPAGANAYPIASYTYILVYEDMKIAPSKAQALAEFLWWAVHDGQKFCEPLLYAQLPPKVVAKVEGALKELKRGDKKLLGGP